MIGFETDDLEDSAAVGVMLAGHFLAFQDLPPVSTPGNCGRCGFSRMDAPSSKLGRCIDREIYGF